ncbi:MAG: ABC transporter ATP-binding protein [Hyphomicrobiales bacterium]|nr:ABC transporter ATP-binding protein [Hyphomicrobiales bacterium]
MLKDKIKPDRPKKPLDASSIPLLKRCWREWVRPYWGQLLGVVGIMAILAATTGAYPIIIKHSYDMLNAKNLDVLWYIMGAIVAVTAIKGLCDYLQSVLSHRVGFKIMLGIQERLFAHLLHADYARITRETPGQIAARLTNDVGVINNAFNAILTNALRDVLTIIAVVCSMFYIDWKLTLAVLLIYPVGVLPILYIGRFIRKNSKRTQAQIGGLTSMLVENLSGVRLLKTYRLEDYSTKRINAEFARTRRLKMKAVEAKARLNPILETLGGLAVAGVIGIAAWRIGGGEKTLGDFTGFVSALLLAAQPFRALGTLNAKIQEGLGAAERVFDVMDEQPKIVDKPGAQDLRLESGRITFENVSFAYIPGQEAVREFSLDIPGGATVALVGRSGAGKSSIINLVPRLYEPQSGRILIDGQDITGVTIASLRSAMSMVSQDITLFNDTVRANIALGRLDATDDEIVKAAEAAAAHEFIRLLPEGYDTVIGDRGMRVSGGQRQRIALARAILKDAPILLLDEATSALDAESERLVQEALAEFGRNRTTLVIAHRLSTVQNADLICVMEQGSVVEMGRHDELIEKNGYYASFCRSQLLVSQDALPRAAE